MRTLMVAAGGGGDVVGALLVAPHLEVEEPWIATCAWERLRIDPIAGPRATTAFSGLGEVAGAAVEVTEYSDTVPPGRSTLPRLVADSNARVLLIDLDRGAVGVGRQLAHLAQALTCTRLAVIDVGGDIVGTGTEPGLLSPLADSLMLAGALRSRLPVSLIVTGPGLDAELSAADVRTRLQDIGARRVGAVSGQDVSRYSPLLSWHPTEASALLAAAAQGIRATVDMRRGIRPVTISAASADIFTVDVNTLDLFPLAQRSSETESLDEAETALSDLAPSELRYEREKAARQSEPRPEPVDLCLARATEAAIALAQNATHITTRRLLEQIGAPRGLDDVIVRHLESHCRRDGALWPLASLALPH